MYSTTNMNSSMDKGIMILPFQVRFENALKEQNILTKCRFMIDLIHESFSHNIKEISHRFLLLVEDIFSFQMSSFGSQNWRLKLWTKEMNPKEFDSIFYMLSVDGPLFKLIRHLMNDSNNRYEFPIAYLPNSTKIKYNATANGLQHGFISNFYANKLSQSTTSLSLNAFEFYMFHFICYITKDSAQQYSFFDMSLNAENSKALYYVLLEKYLESFLPIQSTIYKSTDMNNSIHNESDNKSSLWQSLSSTTTNFLNLTPRRHDSATNQDSHGPRSLFHKTDNNPMPEQTNSFVESMPKSSVFGTRMLTFSKFPQNFNTVNDSFSNDMLGSFTYKCETVLGIFIEVLLNCNREDKQKMMANNFNITWEHMRVVRLIIKHLHYFVNSLKNKYGELRSIEAQTQYNSGGFVSSNLNDPLEEIKRNLWSSKYPIQKNLYQFLRVIFDRWPNDASFRIPLETWLSYIQPWRYVQEMNHFNESTVHNEQLHWKRFVADNLFFYTILFRQVICRISKQFDLDSNNSHLVYRVLKVFAQDNLKNWIKESEMNFLHASDMTINYSRSNTLFSPNTTSLTNRHQMNQSANKNSLAEFEHFPSGDYVSIFSPGFRDQIVELLLKIAQSLHSVNECLQEQSQNEPHVKSKSYLDSVMNFLSINNQNSIVSPMPNVDVNRTRKHLNSSIEFISHIFDIPQQSIETILTNAGKSPARSSPYRTNQTNQDNSIYQTIDGVPQLTDFGRNQLMNGYLKLGSPQKIMEANPDTQPVRSYEIAILVRLSLFLSMIINKRLAAHFQENYHKQNNLYGTFLRMILSPPVSYSRYQKKDTSISKISIEHLPPRVSLRFIASVKFIFYVVLFIIFFMFFNWIDYGLTYVLISALTGLLFITFQIV